MPSIRKKLSWNEPSTKGKSVGIEQPGSRVRNEVVLKPDQGWTEVKRDKSPRKRVATTEPTIERTEYAKGRPRRGTKKPEVMNYDKLGGLAERSEEDIRDERLVDDVTIEHIANQCSVYFASYGIDCEIETELLEEVVACLTQLDEMTPNQFAQVFKAAGKKNPDILTYEEVQNDYDNIKEWLAAALKEIRQLESKNVWSECLKSEANGQQIIPCTWVFRYKRNPAGEIIKCKARICLRGDLMIDDADTYAPVVQWSTIRFFMICAMHLGWVTKSVDWVNAFPQAPLKEPLFMATPRGFGNKYGNEGCLKLHKSLYGSKFAPKNWYQHLTKVLLKLGFRECPFDKCLFYREGLLMILYVDDAGIAAPKDEDIEGLVEELRTEGFDLEMEGDWDIDSVSE